MTTEDLSNFLRAIDRNLSIRKEITKIKETKELIYLAKKYGFKINIEDIKNEETCKNVNIWFQKSKIFPIKKSNIFREKI